MFIELLIAIVEDDEETLQHLQQELNSLLKRSGKCSTPNYNIISTYSEWEL